MQSMTKLEAVNLILTAASEAVVSSLSDSAGLEVAQALLILDESMRDVQTMSWKFNRRTVSYSIDTSGYIAIPTNVVEIDTSDVSTNYTIRDNKLYDMENSTDVFDSGKELCIVELLEWEDLPQVVRQYIAIKAARRYTDRTVGSTELGRYTRQDEQEAYINLKKYDMRFGDYSIFDPQTRIATNRRSPINRIRNY